MAPARAFPAYCGAGTCRSTSSWTGEALRRAFCAFVRSLCAEFQALSELGDRLSDMEASFGEVQLWTSGASCLSCAPRRWLLQGLAPGEGHATVPAALSTASPPSALRSPRFRSKGHADVDACSSPWSGSRCSTKPHRRLRHAK